MTEMNVHALTNLASGHAFELHVPDKSDVFRVADEFLAGQGVDERDRDGFYMSIRPVGRTDVTDPSVPSTATESHDHQAHQNDETVEPETATWVTEPAAPVEAAAPVAAVRSTSPVDTTGSTDSPPVDSPPVDSPPVESEPAGSEPAGSEPDEHAPAAVYDGPDSAPAAEAESSSAGSRGSLADAVAGGPISWPDASGDGIGSAAEDHDEIAADEDRLEHARHERHGLGGLVPEGEYRDRT